MLASLVLQALSERKRTYFAASLGLVTYLAMVCILFPVILRSSQVNVALGKIDRFLFWSARPPASAALDWFNLMGFALVLPAILIILSVLSVWRFTTAGQVSGQLALLISYPMPRRSIFLNIALFQGGLVLFLCLLGTVTMLLAVWLGRLPLHPGRVAGMFVGLWLLCEFYGFIAILAGNMARRPWVGIGIIAGLFLLGVFIYLLPGFTLLPPTIRWISPVSPYLDGNPLLTGFKFNHWFAMAGWVFAAGIASWLHFERIDLG